MTDGLWVNDFYGVRPETKSKVDLGLKVSRGGSTVWTLTSIERGRSDRVDGRLTVTHRKQVQNILSEEVGSDRFKDYLF